MALYLCAISSRGSAQVADSALVLPYYDNDSKSWGLMSVDGDRLVPASYDGIKALGANRFGATTDSHIVLIDGAGKQVVNRLFDSIDYFRDGYAAAVKDGGWDGRGWGLIDLQGQWVVEPEFDRSLGYSAGFALLGVDRSSDADASELIYINVEDRNIVHGEYAEGTLFAGSPPAAWVRPKGAAKGEWHILSPDGRTIAAHSLRSPTRFGGSPALSAIFDKDGKVRIVNSSGEQTAEPSAVCHRVGEHSQGRFAVLVETDPVRKWGFIDHNGTMVVKPLYEHARAFTGGVAPVRLQGKWGLIDLQGKPITKLLYQSIEPMAPGLEGVFQARDDEGFAGTLFASGDFLRNGTPAEVALVKEDQLVGKTYDEVVARFAGKVAHEEIITLEPNDFGVREGLYDRLAATAKGNRFKEMQIELEEHVHVLWLHRDADATWKVFADVEYHKSVEF